ncbi:ATP-binding sensor histidine kinase [Anaeromicrobium sediminis]|uniref:histidine kinase n=1 Tax=Anaeromicrobium sediminis TaxID=1478221 RepID=A0A267MQN1_9FIRM|nr:ATP-binding sensor histidine kinase [Anaeromicrobium sediminis]PAB61040.1 hypothetical protein CCE28_01000 [Anaeromicrobium sediminis]
MIPLKGYNFAEKIYESNNTIVYRGTRLKDKLPIVGKILKKDYPSTKDLDLFQYEYETTKKFNSNGIIKVYDMEILEHTRAIIYEDFHGISLDRLIKTNYFSIKEILEIMIKITNIIGEIHDMDYIYKNLNPQNIIINSNTKEVKIIDFQMASEVKKETQTAVAPDMLDGNILYISPEQTGRMNRSIDFRSDLYSLGMTFYEMLTDIVPFKSRDKMDIIYGHIAQEPVSPNALKKHIPLILSNIVIKLIAKRAEERYQSAWSLKLDLEICLEKLKSNGEIEEFNLDSNFSSSKFQICEKLYGRDKELKLLGKEFDEVLKGESRIVLFKGPPGIGKTFLINEIHKPLVKEKGYFLWGKFELYKGNVPYSGIVQAFSGLIKQILTEKKEILHIWKEKILKAVGINGQIIIDVIPELELVIGKQPSIISISPQESKKRFNETLKQFIRVFATASHPLVIFIDDLQWADYSTLNFLRDLLSDLETKYILFIGAYRDKEIDENQPFTETLNDIYKLKGIKGKRISLEPLNKEHINELICDAIHCEESSSIELANVVEKKTQGNPFFIVQLLNSMYNEKILRFDSKKLKWYWDIDVVKYMGSSDNVVNLMTKRLKGISKGSQEILKLGACIGSKFNINTLSIIYEDTYENMINSIWEAIKEGFIIPLDKDYKILLNNTKEYVSRNISFKFLHDKIQQSAYSLIPMDEKKEYHLKIARGLIKNMDCSQVENKIFNIVDQFNESIELIYDKEEKMKISKLNLIAARKGKKSLAYKASLDFIKTSMNLLIENSWHLEYDLTFNVYKEYVELEYLNGNFNDSEIILKKALSKVCDKIDKSKLYRLMILMHTMSGEYDKAIEMAIEILNILGMSLPTGDFNRLTQKEIHKIKELVGSSSVSSLIHIKDMSSLEKKAILKILTQLAPVTYVKNQDLWGFIAAKRVFLSIKYGNAAESAHSYTNFGILLGKYEEYKLGYAFGLLGLEVSKKYEDISQQCKSFYNISCYLTPWVDHIRKSYDLYKEGYDFGIKSGELQFVGYMFMSILSNFFPQGMKLEILKSHIDKFLSFSLNTKNSLSTSVIEGFKLIVNNLIKSDSLEIQDYIYDEEKYIHNCEKNKTYLGLGNYYIMKGQVEYILDRPKKSLENLMKAKDLLPFISGTFLIAEYNFYRSLTLLKLCDKVSDGKKKEYIKEIELNQIQMRTWMENCEENFAHKYYIVEAEKYKLLNQNDKAMDFYEKAIEFAGKNEFIQDEALANELVARFYLNRKQKKVASIYMKESHYLYHTWGANKKVKHMEGKYEELFLFSPSTRDYNVLNIENEIDMNTVISASQAISKEIEMDRLLKKLLYISTKYSGAQRSIFVMNKNNKYLVTGEVNNGKVRLIEDTPIEQYGNLPHSIINYVMRTKEDVLLNDAFNDGIFTKDPYVIKCKSKSILCMPIIARGYLIGIGYLENNLSTNAFTTKHLKLLKILGSQAAISMENAIMYNKIKELNSILEENIEEKDELLEEILEYDKLKTEFIANISHELRTPLNVMLGAIQMSDLIFTNKFDKKSKTQVIKYSSMTKQNCYRLIRLVNNLIDITKLDSGYIPVSLKKCNVTQLVEDITLSVVDYASIKGIDVIYDTNVEEKIMMCDLDKMERIILNLLSNAIKFTDKGGLIKVNFIDNGDTVTISVKDTGIGILKEKQDIIFDRFAQADKSLSRNNEGSGIGLSLVKSFVQLLGGKISVKSELGHGSEFIINLPVCDTRHINSYMDEVAVVKDNQQRIQIEFSDIYF